MLLLLLYILHLRVRQSYSSCLSASPRPNCKGLMRSASQLVMMQVSTWLTLYAVASKRRRKRARSEQVWPSTSGSTRCHPARQCSDPPLRLIGKRRELQATSSRNHPLKRASQQMPEPLVRPADDFNTHQDQPHQDNRQRHTKRKADARKTALHFLTTPR